MKRKAGRKLATKRRARPRLKSGGNNAIEAIRQDAEKLRRALLRGNYDLWYNPVIATPPRVKSLPRVNPSPPARPGLLRQGLDTVVQMVLGPNLPQQPVPQARRQLNANAPTFRPAARRSPSVRSGRYFTADEESRESSAESYQFAG